MRKSNTPRPHPYLALSRNEVTAGDSVVAVIAVPPEQAGSASGEISLGYEVTHRPPTRSSQKKSITSGRRRTAVVEVAAGRIEANRLESAEGGWRQCAFELPVPAEGPPSAVDGKDRIAWRVRAEVGEEVVEATLAVLSTRDTYAAWADGTQHRNSPLWLFSRPEIALRPGPAPRLDEGEGPWRMALLLPQLDACPGEVLEGVLTLEADSRVKGRGVRVDLESWRIETVGDLSKGLFVWHPRKAASAPLEGRIDLAAGDRRELPFQIQIPAEAPPSFATPHNHLHWFLVGVVDRRLRSDPTVSMELNLHSA
jgi:hypothetical protein